MQRTALFVIDIQNELAGDLETQIPHASRVCSAGQRILDKARAKIDLVRLEGNQSPMVIVFVQHEEKPGDGSLVRGSRPWELVFRPREKDEDELLVAKTVGDAFVSNPQLASELKALGVEHVVAFGIQSECCVKATCKGALAADFSVTLLKGAHSTYDLKNKSAIDIELEVETDLVGNGAKVVEWELWQPS